MSRLARNTIGKKQDGIGTNKSAFLFQKEEIMWERERGKESLFIYPPLKWQWSTNYKILISIVFFSHYLNFLKFNAEWLSSHAQNSPGWTLVSKLFLITSLFNFWGISPCGLLPPLETWWFSSLDFLWLLYQILFLHPPPKSWHSRHPPNLCHSRLLSKTNNSIDWSVMKWKQYLGVI